MNEKEIDHVEIWKRIETIRANDTDPEKLRTLLDEWEKDFGPENNQIVEEILSKNLRNNASAWARENNIVTAEDVVKSMWEGLSEGEFTIR